MSKHTPGPWGYAEAPQDRFNEYGCEYLIERMIDGKPDGCFFVEVLPVEHGDVEANARLISYAPEMYEAIERFANAHGDWIFCRDEGDYDSEELAEECLGEAQEALIRLFNKIKEGAS